MSSKYLRYFDIDILKLSNKDHQFNFEFDEQLFAAFEDSPIQKGSGKLMVDLKKSETMINLTLNIEGSVELVCDRSLEEFDYPIQISEKMILKFGDEDIEVSENMAIIHRDTQKLNVGQFLYEYMNLAVPMKKLHPKFEEEEDEEDDPLIYSSEDDKDDDSDDKNGYDPRWDILKKLK